MFEFVCVLAIHIALTGFFPPNDDPKPEKTINSVSKHEEKPDMLVQNTLPSYLNILLDFSPPFANSESSEAKCPGDG